MIFGCSSRVAAGRRLPPGGVDRVDGPARRRAGRPPPQRPLLPPQRLGPLRVRVQERRRGRRRVERARQGVRFRTGTGKKAQNDLWRTLDCIAACFQRPAAASARSASDERRWRLHDAEWNYWANEQQPDGEEEEEDDDDGQRVYRFCDGSEDYVHEVGALWRIAMLSRAESLSPAATMRLTDRTSSGESHFLATLLDIIPLSGSVKCFGVNLSSFALASSQLLKAVFLKGKLRYDLILIPQTFQFAGDAADKGGDDSGSCCSI